MNGTVEPTIDKDNLPKGRSLQHRLIGIAVATLVIAKISFVAGSISFLITPELVPAGLHILVPIQVTFLVLYISILVAFFFVITRHPGPVNLPQSTGSPDSDNRNRQDRGRLANWRWCYMCAAPKSPTAHHCRRCGVCVERLDHHCIFTANSCIGAGNIGCFMTFIRLLVVGAMLSTSLSLWFGYKMRWQIVQHSVDTWHGPRPFGWAVHILTYTTIWTVWAPRLLAVWIMTFVLSLGTTLGVSLLLHRQLKVARKGTTVLEEMRRKLAAKSSLHSGAGEAMRSGERYVQDLYDEKID
jgi:ribosomal protein L40E